MLVYSAVWKVSKWLVSEWTNISSFLSGVVSSRGSNKLGSNSCSRNIITCLLVGTVFLPYLLWIKFIVCPCSPFCPMGLSFKWTPEPDTCQPPTIPHSLQSSVFRLWFPRIFSICLSLIIAISLYLRHSCYNSYLDHCLTLHFGLFPLSQAGVTWPKCNSDNIRHVLRPSDGLPRPIDPILSETLLLNLLRLGVSGFCSSHCSQ